MERSRAEIILFASIVFGVWVSIWAVIFVNPWLDGLSFLIVLAGLIGLAVAKPAAD